jgi:hypothetical protein
MEKTMSNTHNKVSKENTEVGTNNESTLAALLGIMQAQLDQKDADLAAIRATAATKTEIKSTWVDHVVSGISILGIAGGLAAGGTMLYSLFSSSDQN